MHPPEGSEPVIPAVTSLDIIRHRLDLWNRRFHDLSADLDRIDSTLADAIGAHLDAIGLDDIHHQSNRKHGHRTE